MDISFQVEGRVILDRTDCQLDKTSLRKVIGTTQENLYVLKELNEEKLKSDLEKVRSKGNTHNVSRYPIFSMILFFYICLLLHLTLYLLTPGNF